MSENLDHSDESWCGITDHSSSALEQFVITTSGLQHDLTSLSQIEDDLNKKSHVLDTSVTNKPNVSSISLIDYELSALSGSSLETDQSQGHRQFFTRDAFPNLNSPWPSYTNMTSPASGSVFKSDDLHNYQTVEFGLTMNEAYNGFYLNLTPNPLPEQKITEAVFKKTKEAFKKTGNVEHIRRWPLSKIESEIVYFKEEADIQRAKLVKEGKILDKEIETVRYDMYRNIIINKIMETVNRIEYKRLEQEIKELTEEKSEEEKSC